MKTSTRGISAGAWFSGFSSAGRIEQHDQKTQQAVLRLVEPQERTCEFCLKVGTDWQTVELAGSDYVACAECRDEKADAIAEAAAKDSAECEAYQED